MEDIDVDMECQISKYHFIGMIISMFNAKNNVTHTTCVNLINVLIQLDALVYGNI